MRSPSFIILKDLSTQSRKVAETQRENIQAVWFSGSSRWFFAAWRLGVLALICFSPLSAQRLAILTPEQSAQTQKYALQLSDSMSGKLNVLDEDMSLAAFRSVKLERAFNLTAEEAKAVGEAVGCDYFLLARSGTLRRASFAKAEFYESFVIVFLVNGRSGRLVYWGLKSFEADSPAESERLFFVSSASFAAEITGQLENDRKKVVTAGKTLLIEEVPDAGSKDAKNFHPPMPYKRIKPEYTRTAYFYDVRATVDAAVDIDGNGNVIAVEIERWAGFGLDESVIETIRKMNWRPAERNGKTLPMRVLLRYNFTKIEKE